MITRRSFALATSAMAMLFAASIGGSAIDALAQGSSMPDGIQAPELTERPVARDYSSYNFELLQTSGLLEDENFIDAVRQLNTNALRIPGGNTAQYFDWQRGGLRLPPYRWGLPNSSPFMRHQFDITGLGTKEVSRFMRRSNKDAIFVATVMTGTFEENVSAIHGLERGGVAVPRIEIGNEEYFRTRDGRKRFPTSYDYAELAADWGAGFRQEFPDATIAAIAPSPRKGIRLNIEDWLADLDAAGVWEVADAVAIHPYIHAHKDAERLTRERTSLGARRAIGEMLTKDDAMFARTSAAIPKDVRIWITEWNLFEKNDEAYFGGTWMHGLAALARALNALDNEQIELTSYHSAMGPPQFQAIVGKRAQANSYDRQGKRSVVKAETFALTAPARTLALLGTASRKGGTVAKLDLGIDENERPILAYRFKQPDGNYIVLAVNATETPVRLALRGKAEVLSADPWLEVYAADRIERNQRLVGDEGLELPPFSAALLREN